MERTTVLKLPPKGKIDHYFVASDIHSEFMHKASWKILKQHALEIKPKKRRKLIINGDFLEAVHMMMKPNEMKSASKKIPKIEELIYLTDKEIDFGNQFLDEAEKIFGEIVFVCGNHDYRYLLWNEDFCPVEYSHHFDFVSRLKFKKRKIKFVKYPDYLDIGKLTVTHGFKHGRNHNKQHLDVIGRSCLYGHVHHYNVTSYDCRGELRRASSLPTMATLCPKFQLKRGENNWTNGYGQIAVRSDGKYNLYIHELFGDMLVLPCGRIFHG